MRLIGSNFPLVLTSTSALVICYELNIPCHVLEFDTYIEIESCIQKIQTIASTNNLDCRVIDKTDGEALLEITTLDKKGETLKLHISKSNKFNHNQIIEVMNGFSTYNIDSIAIDKRTEFLKDETLKVLFEICSIVNNYKENLSLKTLDFLANIFAYLPLDRIDYLAHKNDISDSNVEKARTAFKTTLSILSIKN